jgi:hypothetical protein
MGPGTDWIGGSLGPTAGLETEDACLCFLFSSFVTSDHHDGRINIKKNQLNVYDW